MPTCSSAGPEPTGCLHAWARERARLDHDHLLTKFPKLFEWELGVSQPTVKQLEKYAEATHTSLGFLLLPRPPTEGAPIPDFRTMGDHVTTRPSADLLDTVYSCQRRQEWYRDFARSNRADRIPFVGSLRFDADIVSAATIRDALDFDLDNRRAISTWKRPVGRRHLPRRRRRLPRRPCAR